MKLFEVLPLEVIEKIFFYLTPTDLLAVFSAFNVHFSFLPDYFWKTVCLKADFLQVYTVQAWYECFQSGMNKRGPYYIRLSNTPSGVLKHVFFRSLITFKEETVYNVYFWDHNNNFHLSQKINILQGNVQFKEEFMIVEKGLAVSVSIYNFRSHVYEPFKLIDENYTNIFGLSSKYCAAYNSNTKCFHLYNFLDDSKDKVVLPSDIMFLLGKILHLENIIISTVTFDQGYKIKVFDINSNGWVLNLSCFGSTGITNDPNVWVSSNFIGCCDISYRLRGNYFGPFKVWNKNGSLLFQADIEPSTKHYLRCFFKENHVLLTTSDDTISIYNHLGENVSTLNIDASFKDIKLSTGYLLFVLLEEKSSVDVYDWTIGCKLYSIRLMDQCSKCLCSDYLYCFINQAGNGFEAVKFF